MARVKGKGAYMISAVAEMYEIHPQTLRLYEREGLLAPSRSDGNTRLYTEEDIERLEVILQLTRELGVNLAGVEIILNMREKMSVMQRQIEEFVAAMGQEMSTHRSAAARNDDSPSLMRVATIQQPVPVPRRPAKDKA
jgi:MerR family transcriptional regulator, heat shock protein HspR